MARHRRALAALAALLALALTGAPAHASPLEDGALGGMPFTGAAHPHPSAININPSALNLGQRGWHLLIEGHLQADQLTWDRTLIDPDTGAEIDGPTAKDTTLTPAGMLAAYGIYQDVAFALATYTPLAERFPDDPAFRYHTRGGHHYQWTLLAFTASWRPLARFALGATLGLGNVTSLRLKYSRDRALDGGSAGVDGDCGGSPCGFENPLAEQRYRVQVESEDLTIDSVGDFFDLAGEVFSTANLSLTVGIMYEAFRDWWVGAGYQGPPGVLGTRELAGRVTVNDSSLDGGFDRSGLAVVGFGLPHAFNFAVRGPLPQLPGWDLSVGARTLVSTPHRQFDVRLFGGDLGATVPEWQPRYRDFDISVRTHVGLERQEGARLRLGARLVFENSTVFPDETSPMQVAGTRIGVAGALEWRLAPPLVLGAGYAFGWYPAVDARGSRFDPRAQVACVDSGFELDACAAARDGRALPTAAGRYTRFSHTASLSLRWDFI
jgi:hypothetical protein